MSTETPVLAILPTKFRKLIWLKRNDYVIVQSVEDEEEGEEVKSGIRYMITHILYKPQIQHLMDRQLWPTEDPAFTVAGMSSHDTSSNDKEDDDGIVYAPRNTTQRLDDDDDDVDYDGDEYDESEDDNDDDLFVNTNRMRQIVLEDSSSEEDDDEEEES
jgi:probable RNA-binding protein EIF1AD